MKEPVIDRGNTPVPKPRRTRNPLLALLLERLPDLSPGNRIFFEEHDKVKRTKLYYVFKNAADRRNLPIAIRFYKDGLWVWKVTK